MATTPTQVLLFVPNLIGYARIILLVAALPYMQTDPVTAMVLYFLSSFLDAFDGAAARALGQSSSLGALLDMLTDRVGTCVLIMSTIVLEPYRPYAVWFQLWVGLDIVAHWAHMYSVMVQPANEGAAVSHKKNELIELGNNPVLYYYYNYRSILFFFCAANEVFFIAVYLLAFYPDPNSVEHRGLWATAAATFPIMAIKAVISCVHLYSAAYNIAAVDADRRTAESSKAK
eukprot:m.453271 g.453271  ORF g.453271 m.453271 type:complete len:230 (-) comp20470_c0_seq1:610-1299(-)